MGTVPVSSNQYSTALQIANQLAQLKGQLAVASTPQKSTIWAQIVAVVEQGWRGLRDAGDQYANVAYQGIRDPTSYWGRAIRAMWDVAGIDSSTFDVKFASVAADHFRNYITTMSNSANILPDGSHILPKSTDIQTSYGNALQSNGLPRTIAVDYIIYSGSTANWYASDLSLFPQSFYKSGLIPAGLGRRRQCFCKIGIIISLINVLVCLV